MNLPIIAAFDFDHTLIDRDSLPHFLFFVNGAFKTSYGLACLGGRFLRFLTGSLSRQEIKEELLSSFFKDWQIDALQRAGKQYADSRLDHYLRPQAFQKLMWHKNQGHRCLLVSASIDLYLRPWAVRHGFEEVLSSTLAVSPTGHVSGKLSGLNCWGNEKKRRLLDYLGPKENYQLYVYGDSRGDLELLDLADHPFYRAFN